MILVTPISKNTGISSFAFIPALESLVFQAFLPQAIRAIAAVPDARDVCEILSGLAEDLETDQGVIIGLHAATGGDHSSQKVLDALARSLIGERPDASAPADIHLTELGNSVRSFVAACSAAFDPQRYQLFLIALALKVDLIRIKASGGDGRWPPSERETFAPLNSKDEAFYCVHNALAATLMEMNVQPVSAYEHAIRLIMDAAPDFVPDMTTSQVAEDHAA